MAYNNPVRIFVATPVHSEVSIHYFKACLEFQKECFVRKIPVMFQVMKSSLVTQGRQLCVSGFMESECTHLLFIDSDISFNFKMIERMLNYNKEICLVPYPIKGQDTEKVRNRILAGSKLDPLLLGNQYTMSVEDPRNVKVDNGFIEVIRGPAGCMLIKREVIEKLIKEYPDYTIKQHTLIDGKLVTRNFMYNFFDTYWNPEDKTYTGEDFWFCKLCRNIGIRIYALVDEYISHHGEYSYTGRLVDEFMKLDSNSSVQIEAKTINSEVSTNSSDIATKA
jgi:hypothetical protein